MECSAVTVLPENAKVQDMGRYKEGKMLEE